MTGLHRTDLTTSQKIQCAAQALAQQGEHGSKTRLSRAYEISRPTVYAAGETAEAVLRWHFEGRLVEGGAVDVRVDDAQLCRALVGLRAMAPNSIRAIEDLLPVLYPGVKVSYGKVQQLLVEAEARARSFNAQADLSEIESAALDEMFSQGEAVLAGVREVFPEAEQRDDCFHTLYEMNKVRRCLERRAYGAIGREIEALSRLGTIRAHHIERRREAKRALSTAQRQCAEAIERFDVFDAAMAQLRGAIECVDVLTGELHRPEQVEALIEQAANTLDTLDVRECPKLAKYLRNRAPGLALAQASLLPKLEALGEHYSLEAVGLGCVVWQLVKGLKKHPHQARRRELHRHLLGAYGKLQNHLGAPAADALLDAVEELLIHRHRASSALEGFNAALRPFLYVHKCCIAD